MRHLRSLTAALAVLALSAGFVAAHPMPAASDFGLQTAGSASGKTLPADALATLRDAQQLADETTTQDTTTQDTTTNDAPPTDTHGAAVSSAAQSPTPDGYDNHGQWVRSVATDNAGHQQASQHTTLPSSEPSPLPVPPVPAH